MPDAGPWYFAWVDEGTAFDPAVHNRMDEYIFSLKRTLREGDKPTLELVIRNPHIGLLNDARKQWAWLSRDSASTAGIVPVFYGRLIAAPKDIFKELMTINLVAWPLDYVRQRQKLAEQIKASGPYDPVFIEVEKRDDPDVLLEAVSGLYHIDPVTHEVTISDILQGEDGNVDITADEHLYDGMNADFDQTRALTAILMVASVQWNQTGQGFIDMGGQTIQSYAGDNIIAEWPKPLQQLGAGYYVAFANAVDSAGVNATVNATARTNWKNGEKSHSDGDQLSLSLSVSRPIGFSAGAQQVLATYEQQQGFLDPFAVDGDGDPSPTNIPPHYDISWIYCPLWVVKTSLTLAYRDLDRQRNERLQMLLQSDLQDIIVRPEVEQNSETIVKTGVDVGVPIVTLLNWTSVAGQAVDEDTIVFPDHPALPGLRTAQICTSAGTAGTVQPDFSDVAGVTTTDNTVVWASLGTSQPTETAVDWPADTSVGLGTIILPRRQLSISYAQYTLAGRQQFPQVGTPISAGTVLDGEICVLSGLIGGPTGDSASFIPFTNPDGKTHYMCVQAGRTGAQYHLPAFASALHAQTSDGTAIWASIGPGDIPAGGTIGDVWARSYFDTARGNRSIEYLIAVMRARARFKARAVTIDFTPIDPFGRGLAITCRKTVTLHDPRLGGGVAEGKVISVVHAVDGATGQETCRVQIGCAIGKDTAVEASAGTPTYCDGYSAGYRQFNDNIIVLDDNDDVGYTPPHFAPNDDGLTFPLDKGEIVISEGIAGSLAGQAAAVASALQSMAQAAQLSQLAGGTMGLDQSASLQRQIVALSGNSVAAATASHPVWYDAVLKPLSGWQFFNAYDVTLTKLSVAKGIDLGGASTP